MNTTSRHTAWLLALCTASTCIAQAPVQPRPQAETAKIDFITLDKDENGRLSKEEAKVIAELTTAFEQLDADKDQAVSAVEFSRWNRAGKIQRAPPDPATAPRGSAGAQHMPDAD